MTGRFFQEGPQESRKESNRSMVSDVLVIVPGVGDEAPTPPDSGESSPVSHGSASPTLSSPAGPSSLDRPFKILVQKTTFTVDSESLRKMSPIFDIMCYGKDFEKMELSREIVDEKSTDVAIFLKAINDTSVITVRNFTTILRLANKYQVEGLIDECERFVMRAKLNILRPDEVLTLLIACHDYHARRGALVHLIKRLAEEEQTTFNRLKLSRFLPGQIYGAVIGANLNAAQVREIEMMNGHYYKLDRNRIRWVRDACAECKAITDAARCDGCHKALCKYHTSLTSCTSDYGKRMLKELKDNIVDLEWE